MVNRGNLTSHNCIIVRIMADYSSVFGETLIGKNGPVPVSELNGKYVGVYFS